MPETGTNSDHLGWNTQKWRKELVECQLNIFYFLFF